MKLQKEFPKLKVLLEKMNAPFRKFEPLIETQESVQVSEEEYVVTEGEIPIVQNRKAVLYLENAMTYRIKYNAYPKYHVLHCKTLQDMQRFGQYRRYHASTRTDGQFLVKLSTDEEKSLFKLTLCKNCLDMLKKQYGVNVFPTDPKKFPLADWFETFENAEDFDQINQSDGAFDYLSEDWRKRSLACREKVSWICQKCNVNLKDDRHLLHAHHQWGTEYNDLEDLIALCIRCHSQQPGGGHAILTTYSQHREFIRKYGNTSQAATQSDLSSAQPILIQEEYTVPSLQVRVEKEVL